MCVWCWTLRKVPFSWGVVYDPVRYWTQDFSHARPLHHRCKHVQIKKSHIPFNSMVPYSVSCLVVVCLVSAVTCQTEDQKVAAYLEGQYSSFPKLVVLIAVPNLQRLRHPFQKTQFLTIKRWDANINLSNLVVFVIYLLKYILDNYISFLKSLTI